MRLPIQFLVFLAYALGAAGLAVWLPSVTPSVSVLLGYIIGGFAFLFLSLLHLLGQMTAAGRMQVRFMDDVAQQIETAFMNQRKLEDDLLQIKASLANLAGTTGATRDVGDVVSEVKVLQSLVERLYAARANAPARPTAAQAPAPVQAPAQPAAIPASAAHWPPSPAPISAPISTPAPASTPAPTGGHSMPMPPIALGLDEGAILDALRDGLRESGVELALQPIVTLPQRKRRYFECFSRVRVGEGKVLTPEQYIEIAERSGMVAAIDNLQLFRCIQMLRRIRKSNASVGFFLNISHHTLADREFLREFISLMAQNAELAPAIIFEFSQRALEQADDALFGDLERLAQLGYRFSLDQVAHFDFNPALLSQRHFRFMKIEATRLLAAVRSGSLGANPQDFKRLLDSYAIDLIVDRIETEPMLVELLDLQIDFGQGYLFGEPRIVRAETTTLS